MYKIGKITKTHGIKGEVKITTSTDFDRFVKNNIIYYYENNNQVYLTIQSVRKQKDLLIVKFKEVNDLTESEVIKGKLLFTNQPPTLLEDEFTKDQLVALRVYTTTKEYLGEVSDVRFLPSQELLVVSGINKKNILIPFVKEFVVEVSDKIIVKVIEGLI